MGSKSVQLVMAAVLLTVALFYEFGQAQGEGQPRACALPADSGPCYAWNPRFYYNTTTKTCESFIYGGCRGNANRFVSKSQCSDYCREDEGEQGQPRACVLSPETGPCKMSIPSFYYNATTKTCESFIYGGCRGNANRFSTQSECSDFCRVGETGQ